jgi:hypothetical protein
MRPFSPLPLLLPHISLVASAPLQNQTSFIFQSGKASSSDSSGVIDLTMDDEESGTTQGTRTMILYSCFMNVPLLGFDETF